MSITYSSLISIENLFQAWEEFKKGKRKKKDVQVFERHLEDNLFDLARKLKAKTYGHESYQDFYVNDPKRRHIHKAQVCDRIVHHVLYKYLYGIFDRTFISDSYSCRINKGTHKAVLRLEKLTTIVSKNYSGDCWVLKLDIKKFFASVDHGILKSLIKKKIYDENILWLILQVIDSYSSSAVEKQNKEVLDHTRTINDVGIPLGNLTSQIFANIYLNELDQFIKHKLRIKYYLRYADDFVILDQNENILCSRINSLRQFLKNNLKIELHPEKIILRKLSWGIDFCGYIILPHYLLPRTKTKIRILKKVLNQKTSNQALQSYLGYFSHAESYLISQNLQNIFFLKQKFMLK